MLARQLENTPAADDFPDYIQILTMDLISANIGSDKCDRVAEMLNMWGRTETKWPTAAQIIENLKQVKAHQKFLPPPEFVYERSAKSDKLVADMLVKLRTSGNMPTLPRKDRTEPVGEEEDALVMACKEAYAEMKDDEPINTQTQDNRG